MSIKFRLSGHGVDNSRLAKVNDHEIAHLPTWLMEFNQKFPSFKKRH